MKFNTSTLILITYAMSGVKQVTSSHPTQAPTTTIGPTTTSSPTRVLTYTPVNGTDGGFCADSYGQSYSWIESFDVGTDEDNWGSCTQFPGHPQAFDYCSKWCTA